MTVGKRVWCRACRHCCPTDRECACATNGHPYEWVTATGPAIFARVVRIVSRMTDATEAALLCRDAADKLGFDATQLWVEAQRQAALRRRR